VGLVELARGYLVTRNQGCYNGRLDENVRPDVRGRRPDIRPRPHLPSDAVLPADTVKTASAWMRKCVRAGVGPRRPVTRVAWPRACADSVKRPHGHRGGEDFF
jgi:hypothetical protein